MVTPGIAAQQMAARGGPRIGVVGGHGGAGATTLAVALAFAAIDGGKRTLLVDADLLGAGIKYRIGRGVVVAEGALTVIEAGGTVAPSVFVATAGPTLDRTAAEVTVVDLSRTLDADQLAIARACDLVLVVADARRSEAATRRVLDTLAKHDMRFALVGREGGDHATQYVADDYTALHVGSMPVDNETVQRDGVLNLNREGGELLRFAAELLEDLPIYAAEAAAV